MIPIPPFVLPHAPATNITPFTYRDGLIYLKRLEYIVKYIQRELIPYVSASYDELAVSVEEEINTLINQVNELVNDIVNSSIELQDPVMATIVGDLEASTRSVLNTLYPRALVETETGYPEREDGAINIFLGENDPGLNMSDEDYWANPNVTTLDEVTSAALANTPLNTAIKTITDQDYVDLVINSSESEYKLVGVEGTDLFGWELPSGVNTKLIANCLVPHGWNTARMRLYYTSVGAGTGNVRFSRGSTTYRIGAVPAPNPTTGNTAGSGTATFVSSHVFSTDVPLENAVFLNSTISRVGTSANDTYAHSIYLLGARLERAS